MKWLGGISRPRKEERAAERKGSQAMGKRSSPGLEGNEREVEEDVERISLLKIREASTEE